MSPDRMGHLAPPLSHDTFVECHLYPARAHVWFAVPREKRDAVRRRSRAVLRLPHSPKHD